jgi:transcriptional regulator with XRE-family HTH domain
MTTQPSLKSAPQGGTAPSLSRLADARIDRGWTQQDVADRIGASVKSVSRWEHGLTLPEPYAQRKLCRLFGLSPAELGLLPVSEPETLATSPGKEALPEMVVVQPGDEGSQLANHASEPIRRRMWNASRASLIAAGFGLAALLLAPLLFWCVFPLAARAFPEPTSPPALGTLAFGSSSRGASADTQGMMDGLTITLADLPAPAPATTYFAWMANKSGSEARWQPLGPLTWTHGAARLAYRSPQQTNLLARYDRFLITREAVGLPPVQPSATWIATASISTTPTPGDPHHYSLLDHLRHLLAADPALLALGIHGGLDAWLQRNSEQVLADSLAAQAAWKIRQVGTLRDQIIRILDVLDGSQEVVMDVPAGTPLLVRPPADRLGLLTLSSYQEPPGYVLHTDLHLEGVRDAIGATAFQRQLADQLRTAMNAVDEALANARQDAIQLLWMPDAQLLQSETFSLLTDLANQARAAYDGPPAEASSIPFAGVARLSSAMQQLATCTFQPV